MVSQNSVFLLAVLWFGSTTILALDDSFATEESMRESRLKANHKSVDVDVIRDAAEMEMELLQRKFPHTLTLQNGESFCRSGRDRFCYSIEIAPDNSDMRNWKPDEGNNARAWMKKARGRNKSKKAKVQVTLRMRIPRDYPTSDPVFALVKKRGINKKEIEALESHLLELIAKRSKKKPCVLKLARRIKQFVTNPKDPLRSQPFKLPVPLQILLFCFVLFVCLKTGCCTEIFCRRRTVMLA